VRSEVQVRAAQPSRMIEHIPQHLAQDGDYAPACSIL
jgi:hypothetical protein